MPPGIQSADTTILGRNIHHLAGGAGDEAYVFVHGFGGDVSTWMYALPVVAAAARVHALDLPAHGGSDADVGNADVPFFAGLLAAYLDAMGLARAHLVGHSLGGAIATELALADPGRIASINLIAPAGFGASIDRRFVEGFPLLEDAHAAREVLSLLVADPRSIGKVMVDDVLAHLAKPGVRAGLGAIAASVFRRGAPSLSYSDKVGRLAAPLRIIWGEKDAILPAPKAPSGSSIDIIPRVGHLPHLEAPAKVNRLILTPVSSVTTPGQPTPQTADIR